MSKPADAKVTFNVNNLNQKLKKSIGFLKQEKFAVTIRDEIVKKIRDDAFRFKTGKKFKRLKKSTIQNRRALARHNKTHEAYKPTKPNLTFTGRLLNSVKGNVKAKGSSILLTFNVSGTHAPYKYNGKELGSPKSNKEIRSHLAAIGRDPLELSKKAKKALSRIVIAAVMEKLNWLDRISNRVK